VTDKTPEKLLEAVLVKADDASEYAEKMFAVKHQTLRRKYTSRMCDILQDALCSARALDEWRKKNPIPE